MLKLGESQDVSTSMASWGRNCSAFADTSVLLPLVMRSRQAILREWAHASRWGQEVGREWAGKSKTCDTEQPQTVLRSVKKYGVSCQKLKSFCVIKCIRLTEETGWLFSLLSTCGGGFNKHLLSVIFNTYLTSTNLHQFKKQTHPRGLTEFLSPIILWKELYWFL